MHFSISRISSFLLLIFLGFFSCSTDQQKSGENQLSEVKKIEQEIKPTHQLTLEQANKLAALPFACLQEEYPNKIGVTFKNTNDVKEPHELHPAFYGCFDWHSSAHGHWSLIKLLKDFPNLNHAKEIKQKLKQNISKENIIVELAIFQKENNKSFERTYGWAWLLKLAEELHTWDNPFAKELELNLQPLTNYITQAYINFLPKLTHPIRVGEHTNTAFGLSFAWDYATASNNKELKEIISKRSIEFYVKDENCPLSWEPSGYDFLSPCLEEIDLMRRILSKNDFNDWLSKFAPQLLKKDFNLNVGMVSDRSDGKLVHLDGLNFSRAWVLYGVANQYDNLMHLIPIANNHVNASLPNLVDDGYEGGHWLGSFAIYALSQSQIKLLP